MLLKTEIIQPIRKLVLFIFPCLALVIIGTCFQYYEQRSSWSILVIFSILSMVASFISIITKKSVLNLSSAVNISAILLFGEPVAIWSSLIESLLVAFLYQSKPLTFFNNTGQKFVFIAIVSSVNSLLSMLPIPWEFSDLFLIGVYWISNTTLCAAVLSAIYNKPYTSFLFNMVKSGTMVYFMILLLGLISARLYQSFGVYVLILLASIFVIISHVFKKYYASLIKLENKVEKERQMNLALITAMASSIDARDPYTSGHSWRVAYWGKQIAAALKMPNAEINHVYFGGILHDIGKIGIEDAILRKEGKLTEEEYETVKLHPVIGYNILKQAEILPDLLPAIRSHHERIDGQGYPDQLKGEEIPLIARILAVTDAFDAMISDRPYRKGLPISEALRRIKEGSGTQFDASLADVFIELIEKTPQEQIIELNSLNQVQLEAAVSKENF